ncbi:uncharacterized protein C2845_PM04G33470 [Panicum miliaceum]|uniref:Uncharacterized protein n=1 Tax=Panicum miliaceum TaxID=4540 RepID=A0A3L6QM77_PANMI|nr:uncharacterized protein C2845_PM04G33470 [Panicum miliaceum]
MMRGGGGEYQQQQYYGPRGAPHGLLMAVVLGLVVAGPLFMGDGGEAITGAVAELLGPTGLLLLPVGLIIVIRVLSSDRGAAALADVFALGGSPDSVHRLGGSPVGVALALMLIVVLLYYRTSLFGGDGGDDE